jgi:hypothetical protein
MQVDNPAAAIEAKRRWAILGVAYLCSLSFGILMNSVPPILSLIDEAGSIEPAFNFTPGEVL